MLPQLVSDCQKQIYICFGCFYWFTIFVFLHGYVTPSAVFSATTQMEACAKQTWTLATSSIHYWLAFIAGWIAAGSKGGDITLFLFLLYLFPQAAAKVQMSSSLFRALWGLKLLGQMKRRPICLAASIHPIHLPFNELFLKLLFLKLFLTAG